MLYFILIFIYNLFIFSISFLTYRFVMIKEYENTLNDIIDYYDNFDGYYSEDVEKWKKVLF